MLTAEDRKRIREAVDAAARRRNKKFGRMDMQLARDAGEQPQGRGDG